MRFTAGFKFVPNRSIQSVVQPQPLSVHCVVNNIVISIIFLYDKLQIAGLRVRQTGLKGIASRKFPGTLSQGLAELELMRNTDPGRKIQLVILIDTDGYFRMLVSITYPGTIVSPFSFDEQVHTGDPLRPQDGFIAFSLHREPEISTDWGIYIFVVDIQVYQPALMFIEHAHHPL